MRPHKTAASAKAFLTALSKAAPIKINTLLTDNGSEFTDRLFNKHKQASGGHEFDRLCTALGIEHQLTKPKHPQTNGMVERFNGRIADVLATHRFQSGEDLALTLERYVFLLQPASAAACLETQNTDSRAQGMTAKQTRVIQ